MAESKRWKAAKRRKLKELWRLCRTAPVLQYRGVCGLPHELRIALQLDLNTMVKPPESRVMLDGPVEIRIRYLERFLDEPPDSGNMAIVFSPVWVFHPNITPRSRTVCLGWMPSDVSIRTILCQLWDCLRYEAHTVRPSIGDVVNPTAALFAVRNRDRLPLVRDGLFEAAPVVRRRPVPLRAEDGWIGNDVSKLSEIDAVFDLDRRLRPPVRRRVVRERNA